MAVTDSTVRAAIQSGATSLEAVTRACEAGADCGACHGAIEAMIEEHLEAAPPPPPEQSTEQLLPPSTLTGPRPRAA